MSENGSARRMAWMLVLCGVCASAGAAAAQTGYVGILGGGPVYTYLPRVFEALAALNEQS